MTETIQRDEDAPAWPSRRNLLLGALGAVSAGVGAAVVEQVWKRKDLSARFFNTMSIEAFDLPPAPGLTFADGRPMPGFGAGDLAGKRSLLYLWASYCPNCRAEHHLLMALAQKGVAIYGADVKDDPAHARSFLAEHGNPFVAVGQDQRAFLQRALGAHGVPASFVVAPGPTIDVAILGPIDETAIATRILPALAKSA
ncbi:redoxin [Methylosinus sp. R-45379]|uniref:redoxin family protein n=1 Tax=Methylosinus sp. R-45379 TaxID=980563 RepID=UPI0007C94907|nr:redoxin family protein [Methylosinus sp. R-45379]OAI24677.1 redoxin [Methylosinus sp. R-45379]